MNEKTRELLPQQVPYYAYPENDDDINLVDVWLAFVGYKILFLKVFLAILILGIVLAVFVFKEKYSLISTIQIGTIEQDNKSIPIELPESLLSKINNSIVPLYYQNWKLENDYKKSFETAASNAKGSNIILISNKVREHEVSLFANYQETLSKLIIDDHQRIINSLKAGLNSNLEIARLKLKELENPVTLNIKLKTKQLLLDAEKIKLKKLSDEKFFGIKKKEFQNRVLGGQHKLNLMKGTAKVLENKLKRLDETKNILFKNIDELKQQINLAHINKKKALEGATELSAMSLLLIDNEIQQNQNHLLALEERYFVSIENEKTSLQDQINANKLEQIDLQNNNVVLQQKYEELLLDNKLQLEQQQLTIDKGELDLDKIKFNNLNAISLQKQNIKEVQTKLDNYNETRVVSAPIASLKPVGLTRKTLILLFVFLAGFAGFAVVLMAIFSDKVKERKLELSKESEH